MPAPYDPLRDPLFIIGDHREPLPLVKRNAWRGVVIDTTIAGTNQPGALNRMGYLFRHAVTIPRAAPRTQVPPAGQNGQPSLNAGQVQWGAFGFAVPVMAQGLRGAVTLMPLLGSGLVDTSLQQIPTEGPLPAAALPDGTQEILRGDSGILVAGLDPNRERRVFISNRAMLYAHHNEPGAQDESISTRVYDTDGDIRGPWAGLHKGFMVTSPPEAFTTAQLLGTDVGRGVA